MPVETMLEQGLILSWDDDYRSLPGDVAERNQRWRREEGLAECDVAYRVGQVSWAARPSSARPKGRLSRTARLSWCVSAARV